MYELFEEFPKESWKNFRQILGRIPEEVFGRIIGGIPARTLDGNHRIFFLISLLKKIIEKNIGDIPRGNCTRISEGNLCMILAAILE